VLWPAEASTKISLAAAPHPLAVSVGLGFLRGRCKKAGLLPEPTHYCTISHRKKTPKRITVYTLLPKLITRYTLLPKFITRYTLVPRRITRYTLLPIINKYKGNKNKIK
jgi:hypothetical protein